MPSSGGVSDHVYKIEGKVGRDYIEEDDVDFMTSELSVHEPLSPRGDVEDARPMAMGDDKEIMPDNRKMQIAMMVMVLAMVVVVLVLAFVLIVVVVGPAALENSENGLGKAHTMYPTLHPTTRRPSSVPSAAPTYSPTTAPTPVPTQHTCHDGTHGCDKFSTGGVCLQDGDDFKCGCLTGYACVHGCDNDHWGHECEKTKVPTMKPTSEFHIDIIDYSPPDEISFTFEAVSIFVLVAGVITAIVALYWYIKIRRQVRARKARKQAKRDDKIIAAAEAEEERQRKAELKNVKGKGKGKKGKKGKKGGKKGGGQNGTVKMANPMLDLGTPSKMNRVMNALSPRSKTGSAYSPVPR